MADSEELGHEPVCGCSDRGLSFRRYLTQLRGTFQLEGSTEYGEGVMTIWRDRGMALLLLAYVIAWAAVLYVSYRMMT